ncbi:bola-like protein [Bombardia bombarda]|uniref:Bola-like protein n=1 Tax=Bombardia bombarda TaxID=252184 RepID=A0AA39XB75_9PEZI|nr:bola-like protein [Bombardia bombarda]
MASSSRTPVEDTIREKITAELKKRDATVSKLEIHNDSHLHAHHKAMEDSTSGETHFRVVLVSDAFESPEYAKKLARHRFINGLLKEDMKREGGIHALQLLTLTPKEEEERTRAKEAAA